VSKPDKDKKKAARRRQEALYPNISGTVSATECTGLFPASAPGEDDGIYAAGLYSTEIPETGGEDRAD